MQIEIYKETEDIEKSVKLQLVPANRNSSVYLRVVDEKGFPIARGIHDQSSILISILECGEIILHADVCGRLGFSTTIIGSIK